ncbi:MAG: hypothetical protein KBF60_05480 [Ignavibacteriaceae bacterium]|nr:hypothetical protein [Ignavibacteriaceae bacterium]
MKLILLVLQKSIFKMIVLSGIALVIYTVVLYFAYPLTFTSLATVLPPETQKATGLAGMLGAQDMGSLITGGASGNSQLYAEIIKSRSAANYVISRVDLKEYFGVKTNEEALVKTTGNVEVEVSKEGMIKIGFPIKTGYFGRNDLDKKKAAEFSALVCNTFVNALDSINRNKLHNKAKLTRQFIEGRLTQTKAELDSAELNYAKFQKENKTLSLPEQLKASIEVAAQVKSEIITTEIQLDYLQKTLSGDVQEVMEAKSKLQSLKKAYQKFQTNSDELFVGFKDAPELGMQLSNYFREVKVLNEVYSMLQQQYYKEIIQEQKDIPTIEVLDTATPPMRASSPQMFFSMIGAGLLFFLLTFLYYFKKEEEVKKYLN